MAGNHNSGRKPKRNHKQNTDLKLCETGPEAAALLERVVKGDVKVSREQLDAAKYVCSQVVGQPMAKTQITEPIEIKIRYAD